MQYRKIILKEQEAKINSKNELLSRLLALRGLNDETETEKFLNPSKSDFVSPYAFTDMKKAIDRINSAIENNEKILIWGDFDCDGVTSVSILYKTLKKLNADIITYIPDRMTEGHGLNTKKLIQLYTKTKFKLVITVDCGISNVSEVTLLNGFKIDTIITDHHTTERELPAAYAIINPQASGAIKEETNVHDITSMTYNCGAVVAYKLAAALLENVDDEILKNELLIIASCGAIGDVVPILGENRAMVSEMLKLLNTKKEQSHKAIYKLLSKNIKEREITSTDIAFILVPRINAVGRLANAELSFEFLTTDNEAKIDIIIEKLDNYNSIRQAKCAETYDEIKEYLNNNPQELKNPAIILMNNNWHIGIIGIVASKVVEEYNKPCFLMTADEENNARCSIRSNENYNVYEILAQNEKLFLGFGGHKLAGGCSFNLNEISFEEVKASLLSAIKENTQKTETENVLYADIELNENDLNLDLLETFKQLEPYGEGNKAPICAMFDVVLKEAKTIGKENNHLRLIFSKNDKIINCVKWQESDIIIPKGSICDIAFYPRENSFNGAVEIQAEIIDVYSSCVQKHTSEAEYKIFDHRKKTGILEQISDYLKKPELDIKIWAKTPKTRELLSKFENIKNNFIDEISNHKGIMFFDYPSSVEEFAEIIENIKPSKIHFMKYAIDENIENYIKQLTGMVKYCSSKLNGILETEKISNALGVSTEFVQIAIEILESLETIEFSENNVIKYIKPFNWEDFKNHSMFEILNEEFDKIIEFKNNMQNCEIEEIEQILEKI